MTEEAAKMKAAVTELTSDPAPAPLTPDWLATVARIRLIELPRYARDDGQIVVAQAFAQVPFTIARAFTVTAVLGAERGQHAHRRCAQFMVCVHGSVEVICDDSRDQQTFILDRNNLALHVPPTIWNNVIIKQDQSVLMVLCDRPFEEADYMRTYPQFLAFRKANS
jgi:UDP-2-acetamido-3-amino-2,3-dideoxy-glucuronate N-acetyltransferase